MSVVSKIKKKNHRQALGRYNRQLVIRLIAHRSKDSTIQYSLVLTRRRSKPGSRLDLLGKIVINRHQKTQFSCFHVNRQKIKNALSMGAHFHSSAYKLLFL